MQQYTDFLIQHWGYTLIFIASFIWVIIVEAKSRLVKGVGISPRQAVALINKEDAKVFDVRSNHAFSAGHIVGAKHLVFEALKNDPGLLNISKDQACIIVCNAGQASAVIVSKLRQAGYVKAFSLNGGIGAWKQADLPLIKS